MNEERNAEMQHSAAEVQVETQLSQDDFKDEEVKEEVKEKQVNEGEVNEEEFKEEEVKEEVKDDEVNEEKVNENEFKEEEVKEEIKLDKVEEDKVNEDELKENKIKEEVKEDVVNEEENIQQASQDLADMLYGASKPQGLKSRENTVSEVSEPSEPDQIDQESRNGGQDIAIVMQLCRKVESAFQLLGKHNFLPQVPPNFINSQWVAGVPEQNIPEPSEEMLIGADMPQLESTFAYVPEQLIQLQQERAEIQTLEQQRQKVQLLMHGAKRKENNELADLFERQEKLIEDMIEDQKAKVSMLIHQSCMAAANDEKNRQYLESSVQHSSFTKDLLKNLQQLTEADMKDFKWNSMTVRANDPIDCEMRDEVDGFDFCKAENKRNFEVEFTVDDFREDYRIELELTKVTFSKPWLVREAFKNNIGHNIASQGGPSSPHSYAEQEQPPMNWILGAVVAKSVIIHGLKLDSESQQDKQKSFLEGVASKISIFQLPRGFASDPNNIFWQHEEQNFNCHIQQACIIGFIFEPFDAFPLLKSASMISNQAVCGHQCCITDEFFDHNLLNEELKQLKPKQLSQLAIKQFASWPKDQIFHVYFVESSVTKNSANFENFVDLLKEVITKLVSGMKFCFKIRSTFDYADEDQSHYNLNILMTNSGLDYTCGIGTKIYRVKTASEHNLAFGSKQIQTLISSVSPSAEVRKACFDSTQHQLCHLLGMKHSNEDFIHFSGNSRVQKKIHQAIGGLKRGHAFNQDVIQNCFLNALYAQMSGRTNPPSTKSLIRIADLMASNNVQFKQNLGCEERALKFTIPDDWLSKVPEERKLPQPDIILTRKQINFLQSMYPCMRHQSMQAWQIPVEIIDQRQLEEAIIQSQENMPESNTQLSQAGAENENTNESFPELPFSPSYVEWLNQFLVTIIEEPPELICKHLIKNDEAVQEHQEVLLQYIRHFAKNVSSYVSSNGAEQLPSVSDSEVKEKIVEWILGDKPIPNIIQLENRFNGIVSADDLQKFKRSATTQGAITFTRDQVSEKEQKKIDKLSCYGESVAIISQKLLISQSVVQQIVKFKEDKIYEQKSLISALSKFTGLKKTACFQMLIENGEALNQTLIKIYKCDSELYQQITSTLENEQISLIFKDNPMECIQSLLLSSQNNPYLPELLQQTLNNDVILYLKILQDIKTDLLIEQTSIESVICKQSDRDLFKIVAQGLLVSQCTQTCERVIETKQFEGISYVDQLLTLRKQFELAKVDRKIGFLNRKAKQQGSAKSKRRIQTTMIFTGIIEENKDCEMQNDAAAVEAEAIRDDDLEAVEDVCKLQLLSNLLKRSIIIYSKDNPSKFQKFEPEVKQLNKKEPIEIVRDDLNQEFNLRVSYQSKKKILNEAKLKSILAKAPQLEKQIPLWLKVFIRCNLSQYFSANDKELVENHEFIQRRVRVLIALSEARHEYVQVQGENLQAFIQSAVVLEQEDKLFFKEWFEICRQERHVAIMDTFCRTMIEQRARVHSDWAYEEQVKLQKKYPINVMPMTLEDFNRVQTRQGTNERQRDLLRHKNNPKELTRSINSTLFGFIRRNENMEDYESELEEAIGEVSISQRFLLAQLLQSADMPLRARLNHYLCMNASVPLIMNCQKTLCSQQYNMIFNSELIFSISENEGIGAFSFGVGSQATFACGKTDISNLITKPCVNSTQDAFNRQDNNVFSNGQVDIFLDKCYQERNGWVFMDGQGKVSRQVIQSVLLLTNLVFIHYSVKDLQHPSIFNELCETIKDIKASDMNIKICVLLRDALESKHLEPVNYPVEFLRSIRTRIDAVILVRNLESVKGTKRLQLVCPIIKYFNDKVAQLRPEQKFTRQRYLTKFLAHNLNKDQETRTRIIGDLKLSKEILSNLYGLRDDVYAQAGFPSLHIKDQIRKTKLELRNFSTGNDDLKDKLAYEDRLNKQLHTLEMQLENLKPNQLMKIFMQVMNHPDAVLIKFEVAKGLAKFTAENTSELTRQKKLMIEEISKGKGDERQLLTKEQKEEKNARFMQQLQRLEDNIFRKSLSQEYFWRALVTVLLESKDCKQWQSEHHKLHLLKNISKQMHDGDCVELIDGRTLEMHADMLKEILGDIEQKKCIVVSVIGQQSTGKSTLMNFCFGTQFLASTGRCTQGIYFTLQRIPKQICPSGQVEYILILDTEGLNSPERQDNEYDRKIVLFTLLCSDFLIINACKDLTDSMISLLKMCAVQYDKLKAFSSKETPKILYTFVQNNDTDPTKLIQQVTGLRNDVIGGSNSETIEQTADALLRVHKDVIRVLGTAYLQDFIDADQKKGISVQQSINASCPIFAVQAAAVFEIVKNQINDREYQFKEIGQRVSEWEQIWSIIEANEAQILQFDNIEAEKNDVKICNKLSKLWQEYGSAENAIQMRDAEKATKASVKLLKKYQHNNTQTDAIDREMQTIINDNSHQKDLDFQACIIEKFEEWKNNPEQKTITRGAEKSHINRYRTSMSVLKNDFALVLADKCKEGQLLYARSHGLWSIFATGRRISQQPEIRQNEAEINRIFEEEWDSIVQNLQGGANVDEIRWTYFESLNKTFCGVNKQMPNISAQQYRTIVEKIQSRVEDGLPIKLRDYFVEQLQGSVKCKAQFKLNSDKLKFIDEDAKTRLFSRQNKNLGEKYLHLQKMLMVSYEYTIVEDMHSALNRQSLYEKMRYFLFNSKVSIKEKRMGSSFYGTKTNIYYERAVSRDCISTMESGINSLLYDLGKAGYCIIEEKKLGFLGYVTKLAVEQVTGARYKQEDLTKALNFFDAKDTLKQISNNDYAKDAWLDKFIQSIEWRKEYYSQINERVMKLLSFKTIEIVDQAHPNIDIATHIAQDWRLNSAFYVVDQPKLTYSFSSNFEHASNKIDVSASLSKFNADSKKVQYLKSIILPRAYQMADCQKWINLAEIAMMQTQWVQIVDDIVSGITSIQIVKEKTEEIACIDDVQVAENFDLQKILDLNQVSIRQAEDIQNIHLMGIITQFEKEINSKLALNMQPRLHGLISWVACVICWYKLQHNIITKFYEKLEEFKGSKRIWKQNFMQIVEGQTQVTTQKGAQQMFIQSFKDFQDELITIFKEKISTFLRSAQVLKQFDTDENYDTMERMYITTPKLDEYEKQINFMQEPVPRFEEFVQNKKKSIIDDMINKQIHGQFIDTIRKNLLAIRNRVERVLQGLERHEQFRNPCSLYVIKRGQKDLQYQEKQELLTKMSPILLKTFVDILDGTYNIETGNSIKLKVKETQIEYEFFVVTEEEKEDERMAQGQEEAQYREVINNEKSPLTTLMNLKSQFNESPDVQLDLFEKFKHRCLQIIQLEDSAICLDLIIMAKEMIICIDKKLSDVENKKPHELTDNSIEQQIHSLVNEAIGCRELCNFCRRKCELKPHNQDQLHNCDRLGHQMRVFGSGCLENSSGTYPSLKVCDEIEGNHVVQIQMGGGPTEKALWHAIHVITNLGWKRSYTVWNDANRTDYSQKYLRQQTIMNEFWTVLGPRYCQDKGLIYIRKAKDIEDEGNSLHETTLCLVNYDNSGSMYPSSTDPNSKFNLAVEGAKKAVAYLKDNHTDPQKAQLQLWQNTCQGVECVYKGLLAEQIPNEKWLDANLQQPQNKHHSLRSEQRWKEGVQFGGSVNILRYEALAQLQSSDYQVVYYFLFTDGGNSYPEEQVEAFGQELMAQKVLWTNKQGKPKLQPMIVTDCASVQTLTLMKAAFDKFGKSIWGVDNWCSLKTSVQTDQWGSAMIEQFKFA